MPRRHPDIRAIPTVWLMTDERLGDNLWAAIDGLPHGAGIVFRHHATDRAERRALFARLSLLARRKRLVLVRAGTEPFGHREHGCHGQRAPQGLCSWPAHDRAGAVAARRAGATMLFVSPIFATRSHPGARPLGPLRAAAIGRGLGRPVIALGGMDAARFKRLRRLGFHGWAAIDAWLPGNQKRNAVPI